ncbi:MAG: SDR family oxidoreductase [Gemmatimonadota bacterium]
MLGNARSLEGQRAFITGASRGIGREIARLLAESGMRVGLVGRDEAALARVAEETGGWILPCDVADDTALEGVLRRFEKLADGPPDLVVAAAGVFSLGPIATLSADELDRHLAVNLRGAILTVRGCLPGLLSAGRGTLVLVGSVAGRRAFPGNAAYSASKFGLRGFHEVLLEELRGTGVRATLLEPAATDTGLWDPLDPDQDPGLPNRDAMLRPEDVAAAIRFVAEQPPAVRIPYLPIERA